MLDFKPQVTGLLGLGSQRLTPTTSSLLCESVTIEAKDSISISLMPYIVLLVVIVIIIVVSYADWYLGVEWWQIHSTNWAVHYSGPMLRRLVEVIYGKKVDGNPMDEWPFVEDDGGSNVIGSGHKGVQVCIIAKSFIFIFATPMKLIF